MHALEVRILDRRAASPLHLTADISGSRERSRVHLPRGSIDDGPDAVLQSEPQSASVSLRDENDALVLGDAQAGVEGLQCLEDPRRDQSRECARRSTDSPDRDVSSDRTARLRPSFLRRPHPALDPSLRTREALRNRQVVRQTRTGADGPQTCRDDGVAVEVEIEPEHDGVQLAFILSDQPHDCLPTTALLTPVQEEFENLDWSRQSAVRYLVQINGPVAICIPSELLQRIESESLRRRCREFDAHAVDHGLRRNGDGVVLENVPSEAFHDGQDVESQQTCAATDMTDFEMRKTEADPNRRAV